MMGKIKGVNAVEVPTSASEPKPWFPERPSEAVLDEMRAHIRDTGDILTCPHHTHTKPDKDSRIIYCAEIEIPERFVKLGLLAPCPVCTSGHRKFAKGRIAYFPDENVIRVIGHHCFATLNKEAHEEAEQKFQQDIARKNATRYLLDNTDRLRTLKVILARAERIASAIDAFGAQLRHKLAELLKIDLASYARNGALEVWEDFRDLSGATREVRALSQSRVYARIDGYKILDPHLKSYARAVTALQEKLAVLGDLDTWRERVEKMSDEQRFKAGASINSTVQSAERLFPELKDLQRFVATVNVNTLRVWGQHPGCRCPIAVAREGNTFKLGRNEYNMLSIPIPSRIENDLPAIPVPSLSAFKRGEVTGDNLQRSA